MERKVRRLNKLLVSLKKKGTIKTVNPKSLDLRDIIAIENVMRKGGKSGATIEKERGVLQAVCTFCGNVVYQEAERKGEQFCKRTAESIRSLDKEELELIWKASEDIHGWTGEVTRFVMYAYPYMGMRPSELRLAKLSDLDTKNWSIKVSNPKGKGKYGSCRRAPILSPAQPFVKQFLKAREDRLREKGFDVRSEPLVPMIHETGVAYYSENAFRKFKANVDKNLPEGFQPWSLKTMRATFCNLIMDEHPEMIEDVANAMGHVDTRTTRKFYRRTLEGRSVERLHSMFDAGKTEMMPDTLGAKNPLIEGKYDVTGYV
ncbi:MAG: site-specific integrase [Euryarchaeota archaeon]|nr:site-specific integrase [Euryarchaeota archaeon]